MTDKAPLSAFLAQNPFANGLTDGLFYREKMRAIERVMTQIARKALEEAEAGEKAAKEK